MIENIGWLLVHSIWQFALWGLIALILLKCLRRASSATRYATLVGVLLLLTLTPVATWSLLPDAPQPVAHSEPEATEDAAPRVEPVLPAEPDRSPTLATRIDVTAASSSSADAEAVGDTNAETSDHDEPGRVTTWATALHQTLEPWLDWIVGIWFAGMLLFSLRPLSGWYTIRRLSGSGTFAVPENLQILLKETAQRLGIQQTVKILQSSLATVPLVTGFLRPVILLPASVVTGLLPAQLQAILAHELAHIRRYDPIVNLWQTLVETIFFYHPLVWWLSHRIRCERENCCDDLAVTVSGNRIDYSRALLALEDLRDASPAIALSSHGGSLSSRIKRLVIGEPRDDRTGFLGIAAFLGLLVGLAVCVLCLSWEGQAAATLQEQGERAVSAREPTFGSKSHGLQFRLIALSPDVNDESPDLKREVHNYTRSADVTFGVELKNVSEKKLTLAGIRFGEDYAESVRGKLRTEMFAPHFFDFEFFDRDGKPLPRTQREFYRGWKVADSTSVHELNPGESLVEVLRPAKFNVPMDYDLASGNYSVRVRYRGPDESLRKNVRKHWPDKPILDAWPHQVDSNPVQFSVAERSNRIRPEDLKWGKPVDGLRAALEYRLPPGVEGNPTTAPGIPVDTSLGVVFHLQNVSVDPIAFVSETRRQMDTAHVTNERGEEAEGKGTWFSGEPIDVAWTLQPGETAQLHVLAPAINTIDRPGRYKLRYTVRFNSRGSKDADGKVIFPRPGDYRSEVDTGETPLVLYEPSLKVPENSESPASNPEHNVDSPDSEEANAAESAIPVLERNVSLTANKMPLRDALRELARQANVELELDAEALQEAELNVLQEVDASFEDLPLHEALGELIDWYKYRTVYPEIRGRKLLLSTLPAREERARKHLPDWLKPLFRNGMSARLDENNEVEELYFGDAITDELLAKLKTLPHLRKLNIEVTTQLTPAGLAHLGELDNLHRLEVYTVNKDEGLGDAILKSIAGVKHLRELSIGQCGVTDEGLKNLEQMPQLTSLRLNNEGLLTDACLSSIAKLKNLQTLSMSSYVSTAQYGWMRFSSEVLAQLSALHKLEHLSLAGQQFPTDAFELTKLKSLSVSGYEVDDDFVKKLKHCPELRSLNLWNAPVTDAGLKLIAEFPKLRKLSLFGVSVTDAGLRELQNSHRLEHLELRNLGISDTGIGYLAQIDTLTRIDLHSSSETSVFGLQQLLLLPRLRTLYLTGFREQTDYRELNKLVHLRELSFTMCGISQEDLMWLKQAMPKTQIYGATGGGFVVPPQTPDGTPGATVEN